MTFLPQLATPSAPLATGPDRHLNPIINQYLRDDSYQVEQKFDGVRMVLYRGAGPRNRAMQPLTKPVPPQVRAFGANMPDGLMLDGELVGQTYYVFDLLINGRFHVPLMHRQQMLTTFLARGEHPGIVQVTPAITTEQKQALAQLVLDEGQEGIVIKSRTAGHVNGRSPGWLKVKNTKSVDCVITLLHRDRAAADVSVMHDGAWQVIGTVSMNGRTAKIHDVVEVEYLYYTERLVQPRIIRVRDDKDRADCTSDQLI